MMHVIVYESKNGEWRWQLVSRNHKIVADSAEGYESKSNAQRALSQIIKSLRNALESDNLSITVRDQAEDYGRSSLERLKNTKSNSKTSKSTIKKTTKSSK
jgi:uncharacterized protein YegP (UPF0339 family)